MLQRLVDRAHTALPYHPYFVAMDIGAICCATLTAWLGTQWLTDASWRLPLLAVAVFYFPIYPLVLQAKKRLWGVPARSLLTDTMFVLTPLYLGGAWLSGIPMTVALGCLAPVLPLAAAAARAGCLLSGCCYGKPHAEDRWYTVRYGPRTQYGATQWWREFRSGDRHDGPVIAIQAIDLVINGALFVVNLVVAVCFGAQPWTLALYIGAYSVARFALEFRRGHRHTPRYHRLSHAQIVSAICAVASSLVLAWTALR